MDMADACTSTGAYGCEGEGGAIGRFVCWLWAEIAAERGRCGGRHGCSMVAEVKMKRENADFG